jgi:hypothetical protein
MMQRPSRPTTLILSHALVGLAARQLARKVGLSSGLEVLALAVVAHHLLDAPVARALGDAGV